MWWLQAVVYELSCEQADRRAAAKSTTLSQQHLLPEGPAQVTCFYSNTPGVLMKKTTTKFQPTAAISHVFLFTSLKRHLTSSQTEQEHVMM